MVPAGSAGAAAYGGGDGSGRLGDLCGGPQFHECQARPHPRRHLPLLQLHSCHDRTFAAAAPRVSLPRFIFPSALLGSTAFTPTALLQPSVLACAPLCTDHTQIEAPPLQPESRASASSADCTAAMLSPPPSRVEHFAPAGSAVSSQQVQQLQQPPTSYVTDTGTDHRIDRSSLRTCTSSAAAHQSQSSPLGPRHGGAVLDVAGAVRGGSHGACLVFVDVRRRIIPEFPCVQKHHLAGKQSTDLLQTLS